MAGTCSAQNGSAFLVFGDSLVEAGNKFYIKTIAKPGFPNGIDSVNGTPSRRYTHARTAADIIEEELGFENFAPPYLDPNTAWDVILKDVNYVSTGLRIFNSSGSIFALKMQILLAVRCRGGGCAALPLVFV
ncbi:GDSL esterase/lipase At4g16230-like [Herrania umbratica]|uniref:GDSL esterase/lipase At4g16230-like n=1 Tax=Herrania umbratica TaxID=108875 RepID=A0A6J1B604_9ROSI|nr:GDSL esterase/lipase At4g16230-like [Herrania umbratica]